MTYTLTSDQLDLQEGMRRLCEGRLSIERVRSTESDPASVRELWSELADAGVFSLRVPEVAGGSGLTMIETAMIYEELGRALVPGPLVAGQLAVGLVEGTSDGSVVATLLCPGETPPLVEHLEMADVVVVLEPERVAVLEAQAVDAVAVASPLDPLTPLHRVTALPPGRSVGGRDLAARMSSEGALLSSALMSGIARACCDMAASYVLVREQFGRPVGSFQAVKHLLADMAVRADMAGAATFAASRAMSTEPDLAPRAVASAKVCAGKAAVTNARACIQAHGGIGFTWEHACHLYLKRALLLTGTFGSVELHTETVAQQI